MIYRAKYNILVVDDDEEDYLLISSMLRYEARFCFDITWISSYQGAKQYLSHTRPDVILLDYCLSPTYKGIDLAVWLWARGDDIPILMVSGKDYGELAAVPGLSEIVDGYLSKRDLTTQLLEADIQRLISV